MQKKGTATSGPFKQRPYCINLHKFGKNSDNDGPKCAVDDWGSIPGRDDLSLRHHIQTIFGVHTLPSGTKACDSVRREVLCNILIEFGIPLKLITLNKMCLNKTYSTVCTGKNLSDEIPIQNALRQGDALSPLL
jgi:hypothetical protein